MVHTFSVSSASISWNFLVSRAISINCKLFTAGVFLILVSDYVPPRACIHETWEELSGLKREQRLPDSLLSVLGDFNRANLTNELSNYTQHTTTCPPGKTGDLITVLISSKASSLRLWVGRTLTDGPAGSASFFSHLGKKIHLYIFLTQSGKHVSPPVWPDLQFWANIVHVHRTKTQRSITEVRKE